MASLADKYRPRTWAEVIGQDTVVRKINHLRKRGLAGRAYWIVGHRGQGKTSIARLLAAEIGTELATKAYNGADLTTAAQIDDIDRATHTYGFGKPNGRVVIIDEVHRLTTAAVGKLLTTLESGDIPRHVVWIFTTTCKGEAALLSRVDDAAPLKARCSPLSLTPRDLCKLFARFCKHVAGLENLDGQPIAKYERLAKDCRNDCRAMLSAVESGEMMKE